MLPSPKDYITLVPGFLSKDICSSAIKELQEVDWVEHEFYYATEKEYRKQSNLVSSYDIISQKQFITDLLWNAIEKYQIDCGGFWDSWQGYTEIKWNKYIKGGDIDPHIDHIHSIFPGEPKGVPILSIVGVLNDDYEGGNFMMFKDTEIKLKAGDLLLFPSNFIYPHWVNPVTKGTRYSYVSWVY
jgi:predicted 2-oxoglutarate/Fe(II)-dependent dioxygenase YbiX